MAEQIDTPVLVVGAGPFGLALSRYLRTAGVRHTVVGKPMGFWRRHMPEGMLLRSDTDWHLDPAGELTFETYFGERGLSAEALRPLALDTYLGYGDWFRERAGIEVTNDWIERLDRNENGGFTATGRDAPYRARAIVLALGFENFRHVPQEIAALVPEGRLQHTCDIVRPGDFAGRRVLIIGGRQSAFETAALLAEAGAATVHLSYRHDTPKFETSDWDWVTPLMERFLTEPGWYAALSDTERTDLNARFWAEGRLRLEPWLASRIDRPEVRLFPATSLSATVDAEDALRVTLSSGEVLEVDTVLLATGYRVDLGRVPLLASGNLLREVESVDGAPMLNERLESSVPGLYFTSMAATRSFGSFFAFTVSARVAAQIAGSAVREQLEQLSEATERPSP